MKSAKQTWRYALIVFGLVILAIMVMDFNSRTANLRRLTEDQEVITSQYDQLNSEKDSLLSEVAFAKTDAAVEIWAYEEGNLARIGDYPIVPFPDGEITETTTVPPQVETQPKSNWQRWLDLFTGMPDP